MTVVNENMKISEIVDLGMRTVGPILFSYGMGCLGCAMASGETLKEACAVHGVDCNELVAKLNEALKN